MPTLGLSTYTDIHMDLHVCIYKYMYLRIIYIYIQDLFEAHGMVEIVAFLDFSALRRHALTR